VRGLGQALAALGVGLRSAVVRPRHALLALAGFFIATSVLIALLAIPRAIRHMVTVTGSKRIVLLLPRLGSYAGGNLLPARDAAIAADLPGVAQTTPQLVVTEELRQANGSKTEVLIRGVTASTFALTQPALRLVQGHRFSQGSNGVIVGRGAARIFPQLVLGGQVRIAKTLWRVSGYFAAGGGLWGSEIWAPLSTLQSAVNAAGMVSVVWVNLISTSDYARFKRAVEADPRLAVHLVRQRDYYRRQMNFLVHFASIAVWGIAGLLGLVALAATLNAVGLGLIARSGELAVLRAIGFTRTSLAVAIITEVLFTGLIGVGLAAFLTLLALQHTTFVTRSAGYAIVVPLSVNSELIVTAVCYALVLGLVSALGPALHAVCRPLAPELRHGG